MVLVAIKNLLLGRRSRRGSGSTTSEDTAVDQPIDPERQPLLDSAKPTAPSNHESNTTSRFQIDARVIADATIGLSDGLTVPFALTAGLSALGETRVVIYGGLAELIAGAISMGLGGYLGAKSEAASYRETRSQCAKLVLEDPVTAEASVRAVLEPFGLPPHTLAEVSACLAASPSRQTDFLVRFGEDGTREPASSRAAVSALTIAAGYLFGGLVPLLPYFFVGEQEVALALWVSVGVMAVALFGFGYVKTCAVSGWKGRERVWEAIGGGAEMVVVGGAAAGAAMGLVKLFDGLANS